MATVDPIGIRFFCETRLILHAIAARSDKPWPRSRLVGTCDNPIIVLHPIGRYLQVLAMN